MFAGLGQRIETSSRIVGNLCGLPGKRRTVGNDPTLLVGICFHSPAVVARASEKRNWRKRLLFNLKKSPAIRKTRDYIREIKPDITITNTLATPIGAIASQAENIPHDWFIHEIPELARNLTYLFCEGSCLEKISSLSQRILVPSDFAGKYYTNKLSSPEKSMSFINRSKSIRPNVPNPTRASP